MDEIGKRDYYAAVESSAQQMMAMRHHAMQRHLVERRAAIDYLSSQRAESVNLLLLMP